MQRGGLSPAWGWEFGGEEKMDSAPPRGANFRENDGGCWPILMVLAEAVRHLHNKREITELITTAVARNGRPWR